MKIFKPDTLALLYRTLLLPRGNTLSLGLLAMFSLEHGSLDELKTEAELWSLAALALGNDAILDEGLPKPAGEFLAYGAAWAPHGSEVEQLPVSVRLGSLDKQLSIFGDREFRFGGRISSPRPFSQMPITPEHAFGGAGFADNPIGKGFTEAKNAVGDTVHPLPNIEYPRRLMVSPGDRPPPAGFGGVPATASQRTQYLGTFDDRWLRERWPHLPKDTDPVFFHAAPPDQRFGGFLTGNEAFEIIHMHPRQAQIQGRLPGLRARCFINRRIAGGEEFAELETRAESVWLFPERGCGVILYRATVQIDDEDDALHVMADWEKLESAPQPFEHYRSLFAQRLAAPAAIEPPPPEPKPAIHPTAAGEPVPVPAGQPLQYSAAEFSGAAFETPEMLEIKRLVAELEKQSHELLAQHGLTEADILWPTMDTQDVSLEDIESVVANVESETQALLQQFGMTEADIKWPEVEPPEMSFVDIKNRILEFEAQNQAWLQQLGITEQDVIDYYSARPETAHFAELLRQPRLDLGKWLEELDTLAGPALPQAPKEPSPSAALPAPKPLPPEIPPPVERFTREGVINAHKLGVSMAEKDLSGLDLSGLDLSGADFGSALLQGSDFTGSNLSAARLTGASASNAIFAQARLDDSDLSNADFTESDFSAACLNRAKLARSQFTGATMAALKASSCAAPEANFENCNLQAADFLGARLSRAQFNTACISGANFARALCDNAEFYGVDAGQANFEGADLQASRADADSRFVEARFVHARLGRANWEGARLDGATLHHAILDEADLSRVQARNASFLRASAKGTRFDKGVLQDADLTAVNLFKGSMRKTEVDGALLHFANLYGVDFEGTSPKPASLEGANIDRTLLQLRAAKA